MTPEPSGPQATIIRFSLRFRGIVVALACTVLAYSLYILPRSNYDVFPEFAQPQVSIQTEAPGLSPDQVERLVTQPLESLINGAPGVTNMRSGSIQGLSVVTVTFDPGSDIFRDRQLVAQLLTEGSATLPANVQSPALTPLTSSTSVILVIGLTSSRQSLMDLRTIADWTIRPRLLALRGIAKVTVFGGESKSIQVQVDPDRIIRFGLGLNDVVKASERATGIRGAGLIDTANQRIVLHTEGQSTTPRDLLRAVVPNQNRVSLTLANVADIVEAPEPPISAASIDGAQGVQLVVSEQYGASTIEVTQRVESVLAEFATSLQREGIKLHPDIFRPAKFIDTATSNVLLSLLLGAALVVAVLLFFLFDLRSAAISSVSIPLSLLTGTIVLYAFDVTLNIMTLGGFAIAIGVVVDDAVVDVENILRRLRENERQQRQRPIVRVILDACLEVRGAVVYATFATIVVALPILALPGIAGRLFGPLALAYILAVLASLFVALTVTPALSMLLFSGPIGVATESPVMRWSQTRYQRLLARIFRRPRTTVSAAVVVTLAAAAALPFFGGSFVPELSEGHFIVHMSTVPGTAMAKSERLGAIVSAELKKLSAVRLVAQRVGRAEKGDDTLGTHHSEFDVDLKSLGGEDADATKGEIRQILSRIPGANFSVETFLTERVEETLSGYTASMVVNIFGSDLDVLDAKAQEVATVLRSLPGATDVQIQSPLGMPELAIRLRPDDLDRWGLNSADVLDLISVAYQGDVVGQAYDGDRHFPIIVILGPTNRRSPTDILDLPFRTPGGAYVRLKQIAEVSETTGRYQVLHQEGRRVQTVTANVVGGDVVSFESNAKRHLAAQIDLPAGVYFEYAGAAEAQSQSRRDVLINSTIAGVGVLLLLTLVTLDFRNVLLVLTNLPFALAGGVIGVVATGGLLSLGSMVGFLALFGITLRNSILMIAHYEHLVGVDHLTWNAETAARGAVERFPAIMMTSIVTALGVLPLAIGSAPGREIETPMAVVILGGLITSMALNLLVLPTLALRFGRFDIAV